MSLLTKRKLTALSVCVAIALVLSFLSLRWLERMLTFHPTRWQANEPWNKPSSAEEIWITTTDGLRLNAWYFQQQRNAPVATILFFHGNGGNIDNLGWFGEKLHSRGFNVLLYDYRGYGKSDGQSVKESELYADADAVLDFLSSRGVETKSVVLYGQSLGTAVAIDLAVRRSPAALILESGFTSASDLASHLLPWLPRYLHSFGSYRFNSASKLKRVHCPILITHGDPDHTIPTSHARALFAAANEPKKLLIISGVGHNVLGSAGGGYLDNVAEFVRASTIGPEKGHQPHPHSQSAFAQRWRSHRPVWW